MKRENGNALFLILIAVGLLAALTYAVTQSSRGGSSNMSKEALEVTLNEIVQQSVALEHSLKRFLLVNEYDISEIDMFDANKGFNGNINACTNDSCNLFHPAGGGVSAPMLPKGAFDSSPTSCNAGLYNGQYKYRIRITSVENIGSELPDIILMYECIRDDVCDRLNYKLDVLDEGDADIDHPKGSFGTDYASFNSIPDFSTLTPNYIGSLDSRVIGQKMFCNKSPSVSFGNILYSVILAR